MTRLLFCTIVIVPLLLQHCSQTNRNPTAVSDQSKSVEIAIVTQAGFDTIAGEAMYQVSGEGMDTMKGKLEIHNSSITGSIEKVPLGTSRLFEVFVYDFNGNLIYEGSDRADISGGVTHVSIFLHKVVDGTAVIEGKLESSADFPPIEIIHTVAVGGWDSTIQKAKIWVSAWGTTTANTNFSSNPFEYSWRFVGFPEQVNVDWHTTQQLGGTYDVPWSGNLQVIFSARYRVHPEISVTQTIHILMENGLPIDLDAPIPPARKLVSDTARFQIGPNDTVSVISKYGDDTMTVTATGTWCMGIDHCCTADGDGSLDKKQFIQPGCNGGALLAHVRDFTDTVFTVGASKQILHPEKLGKYIYFFGNKFRPQLNGNESGKIDLVIIQKGWL